MDDFGGLFGIIGLVGGIYVFYTAFKMRATGDMGNPVLMPKGYNPNKCKDKAAYMAAAFPRMLILGAMMLIYGVMDIYNSYVQAVPLAVFWAVLILLMAVLVWFSVAVYKLNQKYF